MNHSKIKIRNGIFEPKIEKTYSENENEDFFDEEEDFPLKKRHKSHKIKPTVVIR